MKGRLADGARLAILLLFAAVVRCWLLTHTEVPARDCVDFVRSAVRFDDRPWIEVMRTTQQAPGYPLLILAAANCARACDVEMTAERYVTAAQMVSMIAALLTILPMYFAGKRLYGPNAGFIATLLFNALPVCARVTSDGLSEGVFFLFAATSLYFAVRGLQQSSSLSFVACGIASGLGYLTRPEGVELTLAAGTAAVVAGVVMRSWRIPLKAGAALALGLLPLIGAYVAATGSFTRKPTSVQMLQPQPVACATVGPPLAAFLSDESSADSPRGIWAARSVLAESLRACHFFALVVALIALWFFRGRFRSDPTLWLLVALPLLHLIILWRMASVVGYVSERHAMMVAFVACFWVGGLLARLPRGACVACAVILVAIGLPSTLKPLHANRAGHHAAGQWLASHAGRHDEVIDPFAWAYYYGGCVFREGKVAPAAPEKRTRYVVMEQGSNEHARLGCTMNLARQLAPRGEPVYRWPEHAEPDKALVVVYRLKPGQ